MEVVPPVTTDGTDINMEQIGPTDRLSGIDNTHEIRMGVSRIITELELLWGK